MWSFRSGLVDLVRDFLLLDQRMRSLFERSDVGALRFDDVRSVVGDGEASLLFRLKENCHSLFRTNPPSSQLGMHREALFDLTIGSLFHEAMKFRENLYQIEVYGPKVQLLKSEADQESRDLFLEFEKILREASIRLEEALQETEALLDLTRRQFHDLVISYAHDGLIARTLFESRELVGQVFPEGFDALLATMHGDAAAGYLLIARSYLESAFFEDARDALAEARKRSGPRDQIRALLAYAEGMSAFLSGRYEECLTLLESWVDSGPDGSDSAFARLAHAALTRIDHLVKEGDPQGLAEVAAGIARRLEPLREAPRQRGRC